MTESPVALVTGAEGIGAAAARRLAREGVRVGVLSRTAEDVESLAGGVRDSGGESLALVGDISEEADVQAAIEKLVATFGRLDYVFANAGINGRWAPIDELSGEDWRETVSINLNGTFYTVKYAVPFLKRQGGSIVITSSVNGTRVFSNSGASAYASTKAAQVAFAKMMALELAPAGIRVNVICPGAIDTHIDDNTQQEALEKAQYPVEYPEGVVPLTHGKPGLPEQVADLVWFLCSDASSHITGTPIWIDGAESLFQG